MADEMSAKASAQAGVQGDLFDAGAHDWPAGDAVTPVMDASASIDLKASFNATGVAFSMDVPTLPYDLALADQRAEDDARERDRQELFLNLQDTDDDSTVRGGRIRRIVSNRPQSLDVDKKKDDNLSDFFLQQVLEQINEELDRIDELLAQAEYYREEYERHRKQREELDKLLERIRRGELDRAEMNRLGQQYLTPEQLNELQDDPEGLEQAVTEKISEQRDHFLEEEERNLRLLRETEEEARKLRRGARQEISARGLSGNNQIINRMNAIEERIDKLDVSPSERNGSQNEQPEDTLSHGIAIDPSNITVVKLHGADDTSLIANGLFLPEADRTQTAQAKDAMNTAFSNAVAANTPQPAKPETSDDASSATPASQLKNDMMV